MDHTARGADALIREQLHFSVPASTSVTTSPKSTREQQERLMTIITSYHYRCFLRGVVACEHTTIDNYSEDVDDDVSVVFLKD